MSEYLEKMRLGSFSPKHFGNDLSTRGTLHELILSKNNPTSFREITLCISISHRVP